MSQRPEKEMSFLEHLEELRWHLVRSAIAIAVFAVAAFASKSFIFNEVIFAPSRPDFYTFQMLCKLSEALKTSILCVDELPFTFQSRKLTGQFTMHISSSFVIGLICAFPYVFWEIWRFISPGLYPNERNAARGSTFFVSLLFTMGILFGYYVISPLTINFLANYSLDASVINDWDIVSYVGILSMLVLASGLMFQLPIVVYFLSKAGLVTPALMKRYRRHAIVVILVIAAIITPPDMISQLLIAIPLIILYQISILISRIVIRKRDRT